MLIQNIPNADELLKLAPKDRPFKIWVESNAHGKGGPQWLWAWVNLEGDISTYMNGQNKIGGVDYARAQGWEEEYQGKFHLDTNPFSNIKPEVYQEGDTVEVLEVARECGDYEEWPEEKKAMIGKKYKVLDVIDCFKGTNYNLMNTPSWRYYFPHYAVRKVVEFEPTKPAKQTVTLELTEEQLEKIKETIGQ